MSQKSIEEQFSEEMDLYIKGITSINEHNKANSEEYEQLLEIGKSLVDESDHREINEERIQQVFYEQLEKAKEQEKMSKVKMMRKPMVAIVSVALLGALMTQTAFGKNMMSSIIARFTTGHASVVQYDPEKEEAEKQAKIEKMKNEPMPEEYKGKIFDVNGKEFEYFPAYMEGAYNEKGEPLLCAKDGNVYTEAEWNALCGEDPYTEIKEMKEMDDHTSFKVGTPSYLPEGITFDKAGVWSEADVKDNTCIEMNFVDGSGKEMIYLQERKNCEEAKSEGCTSDEVKEVDINGHKGIRYDNSLNWETEDVIYLMNIMDDSLSEEEVLKIARSIK